MIAMKDNDVTAALADVVYYIRTHLDEPLELGALSELAGFSRYHFHRLFRALAGESLAVYVRRQRLQRAAVRLRETTDDIASIGMDAGYDSPSAFSRMFASHFGVTPSEFRANGAVPVVPAHAQPVFRGRLMEYRLEELPSLRLLAVRRTGRYRHSAPAAFKALWEIARRHDLITAQTMFLGLSYDDPEAHEEDQLRFDACVTSNAPPVEELRVLEHRAGPYAIYRHQGPYQLIEHVFDRLLDAAILSGAHQLREEPFVEINLNDPTVVEPKDLLTDVCIPIV
jgi:AraC family transcriptional regulator